MAGLPAQHYAHFFIYMASPEARQLLTDNETMYKWEDEQDQDTEMLKIRIQLTQRPASWIIFGVPPYGGLWCHN